MVTAARASRLHCAALPEATVAALQVAEVDRLSYSVLSATGHTSVSFHVAAMIWQFVRIHNGTVR